MAGQKEVKRSCCTWPKVLALLLFCVVAGVVIWLFAPVDKALDELIPQFNRTEDESNGSDANGGESNGGENSGGNNDGNNSGGGNTDTSFQFMQCSDAAIASKDCCNGLDSICDLGVDDILYATTHNSNAAFDNGFVVAPNHNKIFQESLTAGFRGVNLDLCNCNGQLQFCHGICNIGALQIAETLAGIDKFLDDNPTEVMYINLQFTLTLMASIDDFDAILRTVNNGEFAKKLYVHSTPSDEWPTLRQVIEANTRVLFFHHNGPDCRVEDCPEGLHYWFQYATETEFSFLNQNSIDNLAYSCNVTRGNGVPFFGVNSFVTPPREGVSRTLNEYNYAKGRISDCSSRNNNNDVNVINVDFWSEGDLPRLTQDHNQALARRRRLQKRSSLRKR